MIGKKMLWHKDIMELLLLAIVISLLLAFYPIRVKPRNSLVSPTAISINIKPTNNRSSFFLDALHMPGSIDSGYDYHARSGDRLCSMCTDENCDFCGNGISDEFYVCSWCSDNSGADEGCCPYCDSLYPELGEKSRYRRSDGFDSLMSGTDHFSSDVFISDDFDTAFYNQTDYLMPSSSFSDLAVGTPADPEEVFYYEGRRYIAANCNGVLVIRPDF